MSKQKFKTLIVAACASELKPFIDLKQRHYYIKKEVGFLATGIGPVAASFGLTHFLEDYAPEQIFAIGTAGIINKKKFDIGEIVAAKTVATESFLGGFYTPTKQPHQFRLPQGPVRDRYFFEIRPFASSGRPGIRDHSKIIAHPPTLSAVGAQSLRPGQGNPAPTKFVSIYSPQEITRDEGVRKVLEKKYDVEHLESFAFAFVAQKFRIPIQIVLGLTNFTDENAHEDWRKNQGKVIKKICKQVTGLLKNITLRGPG